MDIVFLTGFLCSDIGGVFLLLNVFLSSSSFVFCSYYQKESYRGRIYHRILCLSASDNLYVDLLKG
jgi:hypothetical protein